MALCKACVLLLLLRASCASEAGRRSNIRHGRQDETVDSGGHALSRAAGGAGAGASSSGGASRNLQQQQQTRRLHGPAGGAEEAGRKIVLFTQFGPIRIKLLETTAPNITKMVWDLAARRGCVSSYNCAWYRNEAPPESGLGPPYALLQGRMYDLPQDPPYEAIHEVKKGHVCFIPGGKDFFIALRDHPEWGESHPVWGWVDEWRTADLIISQAYSNWSNPDEPNPVVLRILKIEVPFKIAVEGDKTFVGPLY